MIDLANTLSELKDADLDAVTGGSFVASGLGVCTGCTTPYLPSPFNPHPNSGGENPWLPGGIYHG
jgi:hypothetical protein